MTTQQLEIPGRGGAAFLVALRSEVRVSAEQLDRLTKLNNYDLSFLTNKFDVNYATASNMPEQVFYIRSIFPELIKPGKELETEFKKWIALTILEPDKGIAPSKALDMYWHLFILDAKQYNKFCDEVLGYPLIHAPATEENQTTVNQIGKSTIERYIAIFGDPTKSSVWKDSLRDDCQGEPGNPPAPNPIRCTTYPPFWDQPLLRSDCRGEPRPGGDPPFACSTRQGAS